MRPSQRSCDLDCGQESRSVRQWILSCILLCLCMGSASLYVSMARMSATLQNYEIRINKEIKYLKSEEHKILAYIKRLIFQQEHAIHRQHAFVENLISQAEVLFSDIEIVSQMYKQTRPTLRTRKTPLESLDELTDLSYTHEHVRRRVENIAGELWNFVHHQLRDIENMLEPPNDKLNWQIVSPYEASNSSRGDILETAENNQSSNIENQTVSSKKEEIINLPKAESVLQLNHTNENLNYLKSIIKEKLSFFKDELTGYRRALFDGFNLLKKADSADKLRLMMSNELGNLVHKRLNVLQNPEKCDRSQTVVCSMKSCGFGCNFHHVVYCLITAYANNKTLRIYGSTGWDTLFEPVSESCSWTEQQPVVSGEETTGESRNYEERDEEPNGNINQNNYNDVNDLHMNGGFLPLIDDMFSNHRFLPLNIPEDLAPKLSIFHGNPAVWWVGRIASFLFKPTKVLMDHLRYVKRTFGFQNPIVGVHVRRTDKISSEAEFHDLEEYMVHVEDYYDQLQRSMPSVIRRVFLATDDANLLSEAQQRYPNYIFISDNNASRFSIENRELVNSAKGVAADIYFLSRSDFLVCTFSSQVCRLAYELMQTLHGDASQYFRSLDDIYYFGGQDKHMMTAVESYTANKSNWPGTIDLQKGDSILVYGNHWDGFSKGYNERTSSLGLYPSYKVEDTISTVKMPVYPNAFNFNN